MVSNKVPEAKSPSADRQASTPPAARTPAVQTPVAGATPDPIVTTDAAGAQRPLSGGSFRRQGDGTLIRNQEA